MRRFPLAALSGLALALGGCGSGAFSQKTSAGKARIFRYSLVANPTHIDPALVQDTDTIDLTQQVFEGLVKWSPANEAVGNLAESWSISPDGKTYTFKLRRGVAFSNGGTVTAADFKFSIERACRPELKSETAEEYLGDIIGVSDCTSGRTKDVRGITVVDDATLQIRLVKPVPYFVDKLTYPCAFVVCKETVPPITPGSGEMLNPSEMVGTGAFIANRTIEDQVFEFGANARYHEGPPLIDGIERPILKDAATRLGKFNAGELDLVQVVRQDVVAMRKDPKNETQLHLYPRPSTGYVAFNAKAYPPFAIRDVRRAFAMAVNAKELASKTLAGLNTPADGILPPGVPGHRKNAKVLPFDPIQARKLLARAGFGEPAKMPPLDLYIRGEDKDARLVGETIQSYIEKNLGVSVTVKPLDWTTFLEKRNRHELPMYVLIWVADYLDPQDFISLLFTSTGKGNRQGYSNPKVDALCGRADVMPVRDLKRLALYAEAEDLILQDAPWIPLYFGADAELISPRVKGLRESVFGHLPHTKVSLGK